MFEDIDVLASEYSEENEDREGPQQTSSSTVMLMVEEPEVVGWGGLSSQSGNDEGLTKMPCGRTRACCDIGVVRGQNRWKSTGSLEVRTRNDLPKNPEWCCPQCVLQTVLQYHKSTKLVWEILWGALEL